MSGLRSQLLDDLRLARSQLEIEFENRPLDVEELWQRATTYARTLRVRGVGPGDRVAVIAASAPEHVIALLGHHIAGAIHVPINPAYGEVELRHIFEDCRPKLVLTDPQSHSRVQNCLDELGIELSPIAGLARAPATGSNASYPGQRCSASASSHAHDEVDPHELSDDAPAVIIYTSGTTGPAKGVVASYRTLALGIGALTRAWAFAAQDRIVVALPLFHVHGLGIGVYGALLHGCGLLLHASFDPGEVVRAFAERKATVFIGVPTMYAKLLDYLDALDADSLQRARAALRGARLFAAGSAALSPKQFSDFRAHTGHEILERYGMSETLLSLSNPLDGPRRPGKVGIEVPGYRARLVDDGREVSVPGEPGELWVRGPGLMTGYWQRPEDTKAQFTDGWFRTGDVARRDEQGYFTIVGRLSTDFLNVGGFKVACREVEAALEATPGFTREFSEACVFGLPDQRWGQRIALAVVARRAQPWGSDAISSRLEDLRQQLDGKLAAYKWPRLLWIRTPLPRNALGKLQKHRLAREFEALEAGQAQLACID